MKFIHAADLHIDSPMRGLDAYPGAPVDRLRGATRRALIALVDLALREEVDLVLLAGDIFDRDLGDFHAAMFFRQQMIRLTNSGIRVFVVKGNHDAEGQIGKKLPEVAGLHVFGSRTGEVVDIPDLEAAVHGRSFTEREVRDDLVPSYKSAVPARFNIGMLHTSLTGRTGHDPYAPTDIATLSAKGYDYFALGHVHLREVVQDANPRIVFPGNLQGRHAKETGSKGCELVTVDGGRIVASAHVSLEVVRWHQIAISAEGLESLTQLAAGFQRACSALVVGLEDRLHALRVTVDGASILHVQEAAEPGAIVASLQAATQDFTAADIWIESVNLNMSSPIDRSALAQRADAVGEVMRLVAELRADDAWLEEWVRQSLDKLPVLPAELLDVDPSHLTLENLKSLLADAETTVLSKLAAAGG
jgi:exonuclease SbcD